MQPQVQEPERDQVGCGGVVGDRGRTQQEGGEKTQRRRAPAQTFLVTIDAEENQEGGGKFRPRERGILQEQRVERERQGGAGRRLAQLWASGKPDVRGAVAGALGLVVVAGIVVNGDLDPHGTTHLCLQALVLGGIALLAASWPTLPVGWRSALLLGWAFDFCAGIALHFANQGLLIDRWVHPGWSPRDVATTFSTAAQLNFNAKLYLHAAFLGEHYRLPTMLLLALLGAVLVLLLLHAWRARVPPGSRPE